MKANPRIGSTFDSFLEQDGLLADLTARALKRVIARAKLGAKNASRPGNALKGLARGQKWHRRQLPRA